MCTIGELIFIGYLLGIRLLKESGDRLISAIEIYDN
jgi:hypothetical protein